MRSIDKHFDEQAVFDVHGDAIVARLKTKPRLVAFTAGRIGRTATVLPLPSPSIQVLVASSRAEFRPGEKERDEVAVGIYVSIEEPGDAFLPEGSRTIATVEDEIRAALAAKPQSLGISGVRRLHRFQLADYEQEAKGENIAQHFVFEVSYYVDLNVLTREAFV